MQVRQHDPAEGRERARAERGGGLLHLPVELEQHGLDGAHDERERHEEQREADRDLREGDVDAERALRAVAGDQRQPGDDRRERERKVDDRVDDALAPETSRGRAPRR